MSPVLRPRPLDARRVHSLIDVRPSERQRAAIELPATQPLLVLGDAGHGKTTLALLRLAALAQRGKVRYRALVIVPTSGLAELVRDALAQVGLAGAEGDGPLVTVRTYERWALSMARQAFADLPRRTGHDATPAVLRLKRHPALFGPIAKVAAEFSSRSATARRRDLLHLFGDRAYLEQVVAHSVSPERPTVRRVPRHAIDETIEHTKVQFARRGRAAYRHITDRTKLMTVDGAGLDDGTPTADAGTLDAEDCAVMFAIDRIRASRARIAPKAPRSYDCVVLDEAQELAPIELLLLSRAVGRAGTLVVAGDADQQFDSTTMFPGWSAVMDLLLAGSPRRTYSRVVLDHGFRCPAEVVALARAVRDGAAVAPTVDIDEAALPAFVDGELAWIRDQDPTATTAIVCPERQAMYRLARGLGRGVLQVPPPYPTSGSPQFPRRGPVLTTVDEVRGLEFDYVIVTDLARYGASLERRRALYVALTRARHQVVLLGHPVPAAPRT